ncbi:MAG: hypothetical protein AAFR61_28040 [Bacteroidota bacterium]
MKRFLFILLVVASSPSLRGQDWDQFKVYADFQLLMAQYDWLDWTDEYYKAAWGIKAALGAQHPQGLGIGWGIHRHRHPSYQNVFPNWEGRLKYWGTGPEIRYTRGWLYYAVNLNYLLQWVPADPISGYSPHLPQKLYWQHSLGMTWRFLALGATYTHFYGKTSGGRPELANNLVLFMGFSLPRTLRDTK